MVFLACSRPPPKSAPRVEVVSLADLRIEMAELSGKPLVINFWATWCGPCTTEIGDLVQFYESMDTSKLRMLGISADFFVLGDSAQIVLKVRDFLSQKNVRYPNLIYRGPVDNLTGLFNLSGVLPETILYDSSGQEVFRQEDLIRLKDLKEAVARLGKEAALY